MATFKYVVYEPATGVLIGSYWQELRPEHADRYIAITDDNIYDNWNYYRVNAARDGVELAPIIIVPPTPAEIAARFAGVMRTHVDNTARLFGFADMLDAASYADEESVPAYQASGRALRAWRSSLRVTCDSVLAAVVVNERPAPTDAELLAEFPAAPPAP